MTAARQPAPGLGMPMLARTRKGVATARATLPGPVVLVPTMGALHDGHRSPLRLAREWVRAFGGLRPVPAVA